MERQEIECRLLLEGIFLRYGYDFREYSWTSLDRRVQNLARKYQLPDALALLKKILDEPKFFDSFLSGLTVTTTEMFRDPAFFRALREEVVPVLHTFPSLSVWVAGCSTGEEVYSLAILFQEEGLYDRTIFHATDINPDALKSARDGIYSADLLKKYTANYQESGGREPFSKYYTADYGFARFSPSLRQNIVFAQHNLAIDGVFSETHLVLCRNVLIYFDRKLQDRVLRLLDASLYHRGFLVLGPKETLRMAEISPQYEDVVPAQRIFRKNAQAKKCAGL